MSGYWIAPDQLFDGTHLRSGMAVRVEGSHIIDLASTPKDARPVNGTLCAGFIDLQVNGGGGVMMNTTPTAEGLHAISAAHHRLGTVAIMPTVITDHPDILDQAVDAAIEAREMILGLHIEGPHIAAAKRGTHATQFIRPLDAPTLATVARLRDANITTMITLAPEAATPEQITQLTAMGAIVSLGHTNATAEQINTAVSAGARCGTHLFNAMSQMTGRAAGAVGALINSHCHVGIICDGHHVSNEMIALAIRARPAPDLMFLVSDAMATVGGPDAFDLYGKTIAVQDGKLVNSDGNLAGAHVTQAQGVKRLVDHVGVDLNTALRMAITTPGQVIARPDLAQLIGRDIRDLLVLDDNLELTTLPD